MARELAPKLAVVFKHVVTKGSLQSCWRLADIISVPNESSSSDVGDYRRISLTSFLSKLFDEIVAGKLSNFLEGNTLLPPFQSLFFVWERPGKM